VSSASLFEFDFSDRKKFFYTFFNSIFGRIGRDTSAKVIIELVKKESLPLLVFASEVLPFNSSGYKSLDYVINCAIRKILQTNSSVMILYCREIFGSMCLRKISSVTDV
jgi:hypothetical protein